MTFAEFEAEALRVWAEIPESYKEGIDGIVIRREHLLQGEYEDYYTLGTCSTEPYPSDYRGPETSRSLLNLYYGSFQRVAEDDPEFPWEEEIWETVTHELRHHLEYLAADDETDELDYAMEGTYRREEGLGFDPWYFQSGVPIGAGLYRVERDVYIERRWRPGREPATLEFGWAGTLWAVPWPEDPGDIHFMELLDLDSGGGILELVLVKEVGFTGMLRRFFMRTPPLVVESRVSPTKVGDAPGSPGPGVHDPRADHGGEGEEEE